MEDNRCANRAENVAGHKNCKFCPLYTDADSIFENILAIPAPAP